MVNGIETNERAILYLFWRFQKTCWVDSIFLMFCNWKLNECHVKRSATVRSQSFESSMDKMRKHGNLLSQGKPSKAIHISIAMRHSTSNRSERTGQSNGWWQKKMLLFQKVKCTFAKRMLNNYRLDVVRKDENKSTRLKKWQ